MLRMNHYFLGLDTQNNVVVFLKTPSPILKKLKKVGHGLHLHKMSFKSFQEWFSPKNTTRLSVEIKGSTLLK